MPWYLWPAIPAAALGLALALWAWRGRRVGNHPVCGRCRFDLTGRNPDSAKCPECGSGLSRKRTVRTGHRRRRPALAAIGLLGFLASMALLVQHGQARLRSLSAADKPAWWLLRDVRSRSQQVRIEAIDELASRSAKDQLSAGRERALIQLILQLQADPNAQWFDRWGTTLVDARRKGRLSDESWLRFWRQGLGHAFKVRPAIRRGDPLVFGVEQNLMRGPLNPGTLSWGLRVQSFRLGGHVIERPGYVRLQEYWDSGSGRVPWSGDGVIAIPEALQSALADGPLAVSVTAQVTGGVSSETQPGWKREGVPVAAPWSVDATFDVTFDSVTVLQPSTKPSVELVKSNEDRDAMCASISIPDVSLEQGVPPWDKANGFRAAFWINVTRPPVPMCFRITLRAGTQEWSVGVLKTSDSLVSPLWAHDFDPTVKTVDLVLQPDPEVAARTVDLTRIWGEEIVIKGVRVVDRSKPRP